MKKINLIGNIIYDTVLYIDDYKQDQSNAILKTQTNFGGILNMDGIIKRDQVKYLGSIGFDKYGLEILDYMDKHGMDYHFNTDSLTTRATVIVNTKTKEKTSFLTKPVYIDPTLIEEEVYWSHISYLDHITNFEEILKVAREKSQFVSVDFCKKNNLIDDIDKYNIDFVISSYDECHGLFAIKPKTKFILHKSDGSYIQTDKIDKFKYTPIVEGNFSVLGLGDKYAATFIEHMVNGYFEEENTSMNIEESVECAHNYIDYIIKERKYEKI